MGVVGILGIPMAPVLLLRMTLREQRAFSISGPSMESMQRAIQLLGERPEVGHGGQRHGRPGPSWTPRSRRSRRARGGIKVLVDPAGA